MEFIHISKAQQILRSDTAKITAMLEHFNELRIVKGSGIKGASCCAVSLQGTTIYGNSQAHKLDADAAELGKAHAEVVAYELASVDGDPVQTLFCELSPCRSCQVKFADQEGRIIYLFDYDTEIEQWKAFHQFTIADQIAHVRQQTGL